MGQHILQCEIFKNGICSKCNCRWHTHRRVKWRLERNTVVICFDVELCNNQYRLQVRQPIKIWLRDRKRLILLMGWNNEFVEWKTRTNTVQIKKNKKSMKRMQKNTAIFAAFLQQNSLVTKDDSFEMYLKQCIELAV